MRGALWLAPWLFQKRISPDGEVVPKTRRTAFHQAVFERGVSVPWIYSVEQCREFWNVAAGQQDAANRPEDYAHGPVGIMRYVLDFVRPHVGMDEPALEIGWPVESGSSLDPRRH